jgi:serine protease inhibitor
MNTKLCFLLAVVWTAGFKLSAAAESDLSKLAVANNTFAFKLLKQLSTERPGASIFVSPYSAANGAAGQTKTEMQQVLETIAISATALNEASKAAVSLLNPKDTNVILTTANALWYRQGAVVKPSFLEANRKFFSSTVKALDFGNVRAAEAEINQWASDQTRGRITGIVNGMIVLTTSS